MCAVCITHCRSIALCVHSLVQKDVEQCRTLLRTPLLLQCHTRGDGGGGTPLHLACASGAEPVVALLLDMGADVAATDGTGAAPLHMAALFGQVAVIQTLLSSKQVGQSVHMAALFGQYSYTQSHKSYSHIFTLTQGGVVGREYLLHQCSSSGETPVMAAAKGGHVEALKALAEAGGETGATCSAWGGSGVDSLMMACRCGVPPHLGFMHFTFGRVSLLQNTQRDCPSASA